MASAANSLLHPLPQPIPADAGERIALAHKSWLALEKAKAEVERVESILRQGEFAARRHNLSRADQFAAVTREVEARKLLVACLEFGQ